MNKNAMNLTCKYCGIPARDQSQLDNHVSLKHSLQSAINDPFYLPSLQPIDYKKYWEDMRKQFLTNQPVYTGGTFMGGASRKQELLSQVDEQIQHAYNLMQNASSQSDMDFATSAFKNLIEAREMINMMEDN